MKQIVGSKESCSSFGLFPRCFLKWKIINIPPSSRASQWMALYYYMLKRRRCCKSWWWSKWTYSLGWGWACFVQVGVMIVKTCAWSAPVGLFLPWSTPMLKFYLIDPSDNPGGGQIGVLDVFSQARVRVFCTKWCYYCQAMCLINPCWIVSALIDPRCWIFT